MKGQGIMKVSDAQMSSAQGPTRFAIHSVEGLGKTTVLCHFPGVAIVGAENGIPRDLGFEVPIFPIKAWHEVYELLDSVRYDKHNIGTLGFDTIDWLEPHLHRYILERDSGRETEMNPKGRKLESIEDYGYGKGYIVAEEEFRRFITALDIVQYERGIHIAMAMHSHVVNFKNPVAEDYDRFEPKCQKRISRVVVEWAETILFGYFETMASKMPEEQKGLKKDSARAKGFSSGRRLLGTQNNALYDAKNRLGLEPVIELAAARDLIPTLLGHHIGVKPVTMRGPTATPSRAAAKPEERVDTRTEQQGPQGAPRSRGNVPADSWVHGRGEEAQDIHNRETARERTAPANGATSTNDANTNARTWTEPRSNVTPPQGTQVGPAMNEDEAKLAEALEVAGRRGGPYKNKIDRWLADAKGDPAKVRAIINRVNDDARKDNAQ